MGGTLEVMDILISCILDWTCVTHDPEQLWIEGTTFKYLIIILILIIFCCCC